MPYIAGGGVVVRVVRCTCVVVRVVCCTCVVARVVCCTCGASFCAMTGNLGAFSASVWCSVHGESVWYVLWECVVMG